MTKTAAIIIIGNEILSGRVADKNGGFLAKELRGLGVDVRRLVVLPDDEKIIAEEIQELSPRYDWIFTTGGVGPTHDDVTIQGIALGLGRDVVRDSEIEAVLRAKNGSRMNEAVLKLAEIPSGSILIRTEQIRYPVLQVENIFIFPGIPETTRLKFNAIKDRFKDKPFFMKKILVNSREEEIAEILNDALRAYPKLLLGSYPVSNQPGFQVILTVESKDSDYLDAAFSQLLNQLPADQVFKTE